jgi:hypothetical protein
MSLHAETDVTASAESNTHITDMQNRFMIHSCVEKKTRSKFAWDSL